MLTQQVQPCLAIGRRLDYVLSTENVEERPADANVLIRGWRNLIGLPSSVTAERVN